MPDNILKATISVTAPGVQQTFNEVAGGAAKAETSLNNLGGNVDQVKAKVLQLTPAVAQESLTLREQRSILESLRQQYAALSTQQAKSKIGLELAADIKVANAEIKRLEAGAVNSFGNIGRSATKGLSAIRQLAFILPGIGIAGIFNLAFEGIEKLIQAFSDASQGATSLREAMGQSIEGASAKFIEASTTVNTLRNNIELAKQGFISKSAVVKEYNDTIGKTTGFVHSLDEAEQELNKNAAAFIQFTLQKAVAQIALGKAAEKAFEAEKILAEGITRGNTNVEDRGRAIAATKVLTDQLNAEGLKPVKDQDLAKIDSLKKKIDEVSLTASKFRLTKPFETDQKTFENIAAQAEKTAAEIAKSFGFNFFEQTAKNGEDAINKIIAAGKRLASEFGKLNEIHLSILPTFSELDTKQEQLKKAQEIIKNVNDFFKNFTSKDRILNLVVPIKAIPIVEPPEPVRIETFLKDTKEGLLSILQGFKADGIEANVPVDVNLIATAVKFERFDAFKKSLQAKLAEAFNITIAPKGLDNVEKQLFKINQQAIVVGKAVADSLTAGFQGFFTALEEGKDPIKAFFDGIVKSIENVISQLIAAGVQSVVFKSISASTATAASALSATAASTTVVDVGAAATAEAAASTATVAASTAAAAAAAAVAAAALAAAVKFAAFAFTGLATGGRPMVGKPYVVGEKGPEVFKPDFGKPVLIGVPGPHLFATNKPGEVIAHHNIKSVFPDIQFRAAGGPVGHNKPFVVGEKGPEFFVPKVSGTIIPNHRISSFTKNLIGGDRSKTIDLSKTIKNIQSKEFLSNISNLSSSSIFARNNFGGFKAGGGSVQGGKLFVVGDNGPELFIPATGANIRAAATNAGVGATGSGVLQVQGQLILKGNDLIAAISNTTRSQSRLS